MEIIIDFLKDAPQNRSVSLSAVINEKKADIIRHMVTISKDDVDSVKNYWVRIYQHMKRNENNKNRNISLESTIL